MSKNYDTTLECIDWRYSASIVGLKKYFDFENKKYDKINYEMGQDSLSYNKTDITEERYLAFAENYFREDMFHTKVEEILLAAEECSKEQVDLVNSKLSGNTVMKKVFGKLKFDGENKEEILELINEKRELIVKETFRYKKNLYANYCNTNILLEEGQPYCRLIGYNIDKGRKSRSIAYQFKANSFVSRDIVEFDFIPFAFSNTYEALFINNNWSIKELCKTNHQFNEMVSNEKSLNDGKCNASNLLFHTIVETGEFLEYDIEVIKKSRDNEYYETVFIRKGAIDLLQSLKSIKVLRVNYKVNENYYIDIQKETLHCILNGIDVDKWIELLLKYNGDKKYSLTISKLIEINYKIKGLDKERGINEMKVKLYKTKECAEKIVKKMMDTKSVNKVRTYRQKLISAIVAEDYERFCDILLQLSAYSDIAIPFSYDLFEDFERNKDIAYTFVVALDINSLSNQKNIEVQTLETN